MNYLVFTMLYQKPAREPNQMYYFNFLTVFVHNLSQIL